LYIFMRIKMMDKWDLFEMLIGVTVLTILLNINGW